MVWVAAETFERLACFAWKNGFSDKSISKLVAYLFIQFGYYAAESNEYIGLHILLADIGHNHKHIGISRYSRLSDMCCYVILLFFIESTTEKDAWSHV